MYCLHGAWLSLYPALDACIMLNIISSLQNHLFSIPLLLIKPGNQALSVLLQEPFEVLKMWQNLQPIQWAKPFKQRYWQRGRGRWRKQRDTEKWCQRDENLDQIKACSVTYLYNSAYICRYDSIFQPCFLMNSLSKFCFTPLNPSYMFILLLAIESYSLIFVLSVCKKGNIAPIFKTGREDPGHYRSVSITSVHGKIMEHILLSSMCFYVKAHRRQGGDPHGFTKGKSCVTNWMAFYDGVAVLTDKGRATYITFLDFSLQGFWHGPVPHPYL